MFSLLIVLLSSSSSLKCDQTKCLFLNDEPCKARPTLIDLNPVGLNPYYPKFEFVDKSFNWIVSWDKMN